MFFIPGPIITFLTFPGIIVHELGHKLVCDLLRVPVYEACYLQMEDPPGYVIHQPCERLGASLLISIGPLLINTLLCALITFPVVFPMLTLGIEADFFLKFLLWLGISIGMHAFPSHVDMENFEDQVESQEKFSLWIIPARFFSTIFMLARMLSIVWFDAIYAVGVSLLFPFLAIKLLGLTPHDGWISWVSHLW